MRASDITKSYVPIVQLCAFLVFAFACGGWATRLDARLQTIETTLSGALEDSWTATAMQHWVELLKLSNPDLSVPAVGQ